jgi:hypothetical protein
VQTPRFCGDDSSAGAVTRTRRGLRGLAISWLIVGIFASHSRLGQGPESFFPRAKRNRAIRVDSGGALPFRTTAMRKAARTFTLKSDSGCQWQRLSFIRRGDAPAKLRE